METNTFAPLPSSTQEDLPLKKMSTKMIVAIAIGTLILTGLLLYGMNKILSAGLKPAPSPSLEPIATTLPTPVSQVDQPMAVEPTIDPRFIPTPEPIIPKTPTPKPSPTVTPTASASAVPTTTVTVTNVGGQDGWIDNNATASATQEIRVGRTASSTIRGFVGFDIGSISKTAHVTKAILRIYQSSVTGNPYSVGGSITVDHLDFGGTLTGDDYSGSALASGIGTISGNGTTEWKELDVTARVADDLAKHTSSQFRLRYTTETAGGDDVALFSSKNAGFDSNPPQLVVTYY